jgi:hypothetical protein
VRCVTFTHGVSMARQADWWHGTADRLQVPRERARGVYWEDIARIASIRVSGETGRSLLWGLSDDLLLFAYGLTREEIRARFAAQIESLPVGADLWLVGHSAGGIVMVDGWVNLPAALRERVNLKRVITLMSPLRIHIHGETGMNPADYPWHLFEGAKWTNLLNRADPISRRRGRLADICPHVHLDRAVCCFPPHTGAWGCRALRDIFRKDF